jgi:hypothetical protein
MPDPASLAKRRLRPIGDALASMSERGLQKGAKKRPLESGL